MITRMDWMGEGIPALGLGTWAIGGPFFAGDDAVGWGETDDAVSLAAISEGVAAGVRLFDTAQAYGTGHAEELLGRALAQHPEVRVATKIGIGIDPVRRQLMGEELEPQRIREGIEASRRRLGRDRIDLVLLHLNSLPVAQAEPVFDVLSDLRAANVIGAFGWSTDFPDRAAAFAERDGFVAIEHALNVFFGADALLPVIEANGLLSINRSPLAMGLLGGRYGTDSRLPRDDVRGRSRDWMDYFKDGRVSDSHSRRSASGSRCADGRRPYACAGRAGLDLGPVGADFAGPRLPYARTGPGPRGRPRERPAQSGPDAGGRAAH